MAFVWNPENKFTMLSIDGGGMRGVIPLAMLVWLEEQTGKPAYELFDMVAGTSTGAIIAAGLAIKLTAREILESIYKKDLPKAFGNQRGILFWMRYFINGMRYFYPNEPFIKVLVPYTRGLKMSQIGRGADGNIETTVLFTAHDMRTSNTYYVVNRGEGAPMFADWTVSGAVGASTSAPIFFPPVLGNFIDGGAGKSGNPCLASAIEAVEYIGIPESNILHFSLGTGHIPSGKAEGGGSKIWLLDWANYLVAHSIQEVALDQAYSTRSVYKQMDFRRYNPTLTVQNVRDVLGLELGNINPLKLSLDSSRPEEIELLERIGGAYASKIDWSVERALPWYTVGGQPKPSIAPTHWQGTPFV